MGNGVGKKKQRLHFDNYKPTNNSTTSYSRRFSRTSFSKRLSSVFIPVTEQRTSSHREVKADNGVVVTLSEDGDSVSLNPTYLSSYRSYMPEWTMNVNPTITPEMQLDVENYWEAVCTEKENGDGNNQQLLFYDILSSCVLQACPEANKLFTKKALASILMSEAKNSLDKTIKVVSLRKTSLNFIKAMDCDNTELCSEKKVRMAIKVTQAFLLALELLLLQEDNQQPGGVVWNQQLSLSFLAIASVDLYLMLPRLLETQEEVVDGLQ